MPRSARTRSSTSSTGPSYYDLRNSDVYHVFARRKGIPITLSVLYVAIARRAGIELTMGDGQPYNLRLRTNQEQYIQAVEGQHPYLVIAPPPCTALSSLLTILV